MDLKKILIPVPLLAAGAIAATGCGTTNSNAQSPQAGAAPTDPPPTATTSATPAAAPTTTGGPITVSLTEFKMAPSATSAPAGKVTFKVTNDGKIPHEMVVLKTDKSAAALGKPGAARVPETGHQGEIELKPGKSGTVKLDLKAGHYVLVCNLPGHWAGGMRTDFTVK